MFNSDIVSFIRHHNEEIKTVHHNHVYIILL